MSEQIKLTIGDKVKFAEEKHSYTVNAANGRYAVCTKPFNPQKTVLYSLVDFVENVRGPNNLVFNCYDYKTEQGCRDSLAALIRGDIQISRRRQIPLVIKSIKTVPHE